MAVRVDQWGELTSPQPAPVSLDEKALLGAIEFMKPSAEKYATGELDIFKQLKGCAICSYRRWEARRAKQITKTTSVIKRPAAAAADMQYFDAADDIATEAIVTVAVESPAPRPQRQQQF